MEESQTWLQKAEDDLGWTKHNIKGKIYYGACFSAQQAGEKALKAYLIFKRKKLRKIHDTRALLQSCITIDKSFSKLRLACATLSGYYIQSRYPMFEDFAEFTKEQAQEAYKFATEIVIFIKEKIYQE